MPVVYQSYRAVDWHTKPQLFAAVLAVAMVIVCGCEDRAPPSVVQRQVAQTSPHLHVLGDEDDVGSIVFVDRKQAAVIEGNFLSPIQVFIALTPGRHLVEIRKNGQLRARSVLQVEASTGKLLMPARVNPPQSPDLTPDRPDP